MRTPSPSTSPSPGRPRWVSFAAGAVIVIVAVVVFAVLRSGDDDPGPLGAGATGSSGATSARAEPVAATSEQLAALAEKRKRPVYWVGPSAGRTYELTQTTDGAVYVRYLDRGVAIGDARPNFLTVGSYPMNDPFKTVTQAAERPGAQVEELEDGGRAVANRSRPNSWYVAYPDSKELVEVFSPRAGRARTLVRARRVVPVEG